LKKVDIASLLLLGGLWYLVSMISLQAEWALVEDRSKMGIIDILSRSHWDSLAFTISFYNMFMITKKVGKSPATVSIVHFVMSNPIGRSFDIPFL